MMRTVDALSFGTGCTARLGRTSLSAAYRLGPNRTATPAPPAPVQHRVRTRRGPRPHALALVERYVPGQAGAPGRRADVQADAEGGGGVPDAAEFRGGRRIGRDSRRGGPPASRPH